jgi:FlaA1/EpsC-like NDP-sugar epimerase
VVQAIVLYGAMVMPVLVGARTIGQFIEDGMGWLNRRHEPGRRRLLLYGGGRRCMLYLRELSYDHPDGPTGVGVLGLLDDDTNLHGRSVYGYRVLGGLAALEGGLLPPADEIVIVSDLDDGARRRLLSEAGRRGTAVSEWKPVSSPLIAAADVSG